MYETDDTLTLDQANKFMELVDKEVGTEMELNPSASGKPDQYYVVVFDLEEMSEYDYCNKAEDICQS